MWLDQLDQVVLLQPLFAVVEAAPIVKHLGSEEHGLSAAENSPLPI